jgi:coenzyme F420 hydrogenase subunit beta
LTEWAEVVAGSVAGRDEVAFGAMAIRDLETVVKSGLCTGCGICESVAGREHVEMQLSSIGQLRPRVKRPLPRALEERALAACPGVEVVGPAEQPGIRMSPVWGPIASLQRGWAADPKIRWHAAAGGAMTALGVYLLESGQVDAILHVRASESDPLQTDAQVSRTREEVIAGAQSRYGPASPLVHVHRLLDEGVRFAVLAKPCDISAVRALQRVDARARDNIRACVTMFCGGVPSLRMAHAIVRHHGVEPGEVTLFRFRGEGWPGPMRTVTADERTFDVSYDEAWYDPAATWTYDMQWRCKVCPDAIGEVADVSCPDGWVMLDGEPLHEEGPDGVNLVIARTDTGRRLVEAAAQAGYLETAPCSHAELDVMHRDHYPRKLSAPVRALGMRAGGQPALRIRRYRTLTVTRRAGLRATVSALIGSWRRVRRGANREPLP